ncbi:hypothetical protein M885DRAFT_256605 [Pelagophyceae sp. CCMP2097]|nr:hypothetical protein M885DRAFT_256605 [Pelagophyceae sp. CCMP2097]
MKRRDDVRPGTATTPHKVVAFAQRLEVPLLHAPFRTPPAIARPRHRTPDCPSQVPAPHGATPTTPTTRDRRSADVTPPSHERTPTATSPPSSPVGGTARRGLFQQAAASPRCDEAAVRQNLFAAAHEPASPAVQKASRQNLFTAHEPSSPAVRKQEPFSPAVKGAPKHVELLESPPKFGERGDYAEQRRPKSAVGKPPAARPTDFAAVPRRPPPQLPRDTKSAAPTDDPPSDDAAPTPTTPAAGRDYGGPAHGAWSHDGGRYGVSASPPNISPPSRVSPSTPYEQRHGAFSGLLSAHTAHHTAHAPAAARHATTPRGVGHTPNAGGRNTPSCDCPAPRPGCGGDDSRIDRYHVKRMSIV